jgi:ribosome-associated protein
MKMVKYIELNTFIKIKGLAQSGGSAKQLIRSEAVKVNNKIETQNKKKLVSGDKVTVNNKEYVVERSMCQKENRIK